MSTRFKLTISLLALASISLLISVIIIMSVQFGKLSKELSDVKASFISYKLDVAKVAEQSLKLQQDLDDEKVKNDALRDRVDSDFTSLSVNISRYSTTTAELIEETAQLSRTVRQDYFNFRQQLKESELTIIGWQRYYCEIIAPNNGTQSLCIRINQLSN